MRQILYSRPLLLLVTLAALSVLWIAEWVNWRRFVKLQMGPTDGFYAMAGGRCRTI